MRYLRSKSRPAACLEQTIYSDTLLSAIAGRPVVKECWEPHGGADRQ